MVESGNGILPGESSRVFKLLKTDGPSIPPWRQSLAIQQTHNYKATILQTGLQTIRTFRNKKACRKLLGTVLDQGDTPRQGGFVDGAAGQG